MTRGLALATYAVHAETSRGRLHHEPEAPTRSAYQRDRDRIIHSSAFRKLQYKTQVFVNHEGDYYRTRLTHSTEAAQISRTIARAMGLNEDLCGRRIGRSWPRTARASALPAVPIPVG